MGCVWPLRSGLQPSTLFSLADTRFTAPAWHGGELRRHTRPTSAQLSPAHLYCWLRLKCADTPPPPFASGPEGAEGHCTLLSASHTAAPGITRVPWLAGRQTARMRAACSW